MVNLQTFVYSSLILFILQNVVSATTTPCSAINCGTGQCCQDSVSGPACYSTSQYVCAVSSDGSSTRLCPLGSGVCNGNCFQLNLYSCQNNALVQGATVVSPALPTVPAAHTTAPTIPATTLAPTHAATVAPTHAATVAPTHAATSAPTSPASTAGTCNANCGSGLACCADSVNGDMCYNPASYVCAVNGNQARLCPLGSGVCANNCYQLSAYTCVANALVAGAASPSSPSGSASTTGATSTTGTAASSTSTTGTAVHTTSPPATSQPTTPVTSTPATTSPATPAPTVPSAPVSGKFTPLQPFCSGTCPSPASLGFETGRNAIPRSSPDGVNPWPVADACDGGWTYGTPPRATWWDNYASTPALPTNTWFIPYFSNPPYAVNAEGLTWPVYQLPYTTQATNAGFLMGVPTPSQINGLPGQFDGSPPPVLQFGLTTQQFTFMTTDGFLPGKKITDYDPDGLGITLQYTTNGGKTMTVPVIRGHVFVTVIYQSGATPMLQYQLGDIGSVNNIETINQITTVISPTLSSTGLYIYDFDILSAGVTSYRYRLYSNQNIPITVQKPIASGCIVLPWQVTFNAPCNGNCIFRMACYLSTYEDPVNPVPFFNGTLTIPTSVLDASANVYPLVNSQNTNRTVQFYDGGDTAMYQYFYWNTACVISGVASCNPSLLLNLALPHHLDLLPSSQIMKTVSYSTQTGIAYGILGNSWTLSFNVANVVGSTLLNDPFQYQTPITDATTISTIVTNLISDMNGLTGPNSYATFDGADCYSFGKYIASVARLTLIADSLGQTAIAAQGRTTLRERLDSWFNPAATVFPFRTADQLTYDTVWGGLIPLDAVTEPGALWIADTTTQPEFGSGGYNDHLFHYGYFLYAIAATLKSGSAVDVAWFQNSQNRILAMARDVANPNWQEDPYFAGFRYKSDWYVGHSWACGLFPSGDYPNIESTSEALNAWYGLYLLGTAMADNGMATIGNNMKFVGKVLSVTDTQSFHFYSRMYPAPTGNNALVYPTDFTSLGIIGNLWGGQALYQTYFGFGACEDMSLPFQPSWPPSCIQRHILTTDQVRYYNSLMVFLIQCMPFTPFSQSLNNRTWLNAGFLTQGITFQNPDGTYSPSYTPDGKASQIPDFFNRCADNDGCDSWIGYAWQTLSSLGASNRQASFTELLQYGEAPAGTTITNILFHIASQPN